MDLKLILQNLKMMIFQIFYIKIFILFQIIQLIIKKEENYLNPIKNKEKIII